MCTLVTIQLINRQLQRLRQRRTHRGERSSPRRPATHPTWCTPSNRKMHSTILQRHHTATRSHPPYRPGARAKTRLSRAGSFKCYEKRDSLPSVNFFFGPPILPMLLTGSWLQLLMLTYWMQLSRNIVRMSIPLWQAVLHHHVTH